MEQIQLSQVDVNLRRQAIQDMAYRSWENAGRKGTIVMATGVGKSKLGVRRVQEIAETSVVIPQVGLEPVLLVTPTEKLRDENWPAEFRKWGAGSLCDIFVKRICFASLKNEKGNRYKLVILDEAHRITAHNAEGFLEDGSLTEFFAENMADEIMSLTATEPDIARDMMKHSILNQIAPVCFRYTLDQAVADGIVPGYEIRIILVPLDNITKNIEGGKKGSKFLTTEMAHYAYLNKKCIKAFASKKKGFITAMTGTRAAFLKSLPSKTRVARHVLKKVLPGKRTLVFCGTIEQSRELCGENVYNSSPEDKKRDMLTAFKNLEIDYLGVVNAVNEGHNIDLIDQAVAVQVSSNERDFVQRLGRLLRYRPGHQPIMYVIVAQNTQDQQWLNEALEGFDRSRIVYDSYLNYIV